MSVVTQSHPTPNHDQTTEYQHDQLLSETLGLTTGLMTWLRVGTSIPGERNQLAPGVIALAPLGGWDAIGQRVSNPSAEDRSGPHVSPNSPVSGTGSRCTD